MHNATPATPFVKSPKEMNFKIVKHYFTKILFLLMQLKPQCGSGRRGRCGRRLEACSTCESRPPAPRRGCRQPAADQHAWGLQGDPPWVVENRKSSQI